MDLLKDLAIVGALFVTVDDLVVPDTNTSVAVLKEPVRLVAKPLVGLHGHPHEVEGVSRWIVGCLELDVKA
jgi:hypothetical protein